MKNPQNLEDASDLCGYILSHILPIYEEFGEISGNLDVFPLRRIAET